MAITLIIGFVLLTTLLWLWVIIDIVKSNFKNQNKNIVWLLIVLFFPVLGSIIYFQLRKKLIINEPKTFQPNFNQTK